MKHIFIINIKAGLGKIQEELILEIPKVAKEENVAYEIYIPKSIEDSIRYIKQKVETKEELRFYACGGDGTLSCVANSIIGYNNCELAMLPIGTGNDFPKNFENRKLFNDLKAQFNGKASKIDLIKCFNKEENFKTYCVNMVNIGFDSDVAKKVQDLKRYPLIGGKFSYITSLVFTLAKKIGKEFNITLDNKENFNKNCLLVCIANGSFCGGGFNSAPYAYLDDEKMDVSIVEKVSKLVFVGLVGDYKKGTHLDTKKGKEIVTYKRCSEVSFKAKEEYNLCVDGDIYVMKETSFKIIPNSIKFSIPKGVRYIKKQKKLAQ